MMLFFGQLLLLYFNKQKTQTQPFFFFNVFFMNRMATSCFAVKLSAERQHNQMKQNDRYRRSITECVVRMIIRHSFNIYQVAV